MKPQVVLLKPHFTASLHSVKRCRYVALKTGNSNGGEHRLVLVIKRGSWRTAAARTHPGETQTPHDGLLVLLSAWRRRPGGDFSDLRPSSGVKLWSDVTRQEVVDDLFQRA